MSSECRTLYQAGRKGTRGTLTKIRLSSPLLIGFAMTYSLPSMHIRLSASARQLYTCLFSWNTLCYGLNHLSCQCLFGLLCVYFSYQFLSLLRLCVYISINLRGVAGRFYCQAHHFWLRRVFTYVNDFSPESRVGFWPCKVMRGLHCCGNLLESSVFG